MNITALTSPTNALTEIRQTAGASADLDGDRDANQGLDDLGRVLRTPPASSTRPAPSVDSYTPSPVSLEPSASRSVALAMFPQADTNHDGSVTLSELIASFSQLDRTP